MSVVRSVWRSVGLARTLLGNRPVGWQNIQRLGPHKPCQTLLIRRLSTNQPSDSVQGDRQAQQSSSKDGNKKTKDVTSNPFFDRYKAKLEAAAQAKGISLEEAPVDQPSEKIAQAAGHHVAAKSKQDRVNKPSSSTSTAPESTATRPSFVGPSRLPPTVTPLDSIIRLDKLAGLAGDQIKYLWEQHHKSQDVLFAAIPSDKYNQLFQRGRACPHFLHVLPREDGFEFYISMFSEHQCAFTSLLEYKMRQDHARPLLTLNYYTELSDSKGIVLMRGEYNKDFLASTDAHLLAMQLQLYYANEKDDQAFQLVETFNHRPTEFDHNALLDRFNELLPGTPNPIAQEPQQ